MPYWRIEHQQSFHRAATQVEVTIKVEIKPRDTPTTDEHDFLTRGIAY